MEFEVFEWVQMGGSDGADRYFISFFVHLTRDGLLIVVFIANENAARQARLRAEISQATRENKTYIRNVERAKMVENMQAAAKEKRKAAGGDDSGVPETTTSDKDKIRRTFKQRTAVTKTVKAGEKGKGEKSDAMKKLLSTVF